VDADAGPVLVLDAGTGLRRAGLALAGDRRPVHVLLTHLHMDHIQGLGFFRPLFEPGREVHIWGPSSTTQDLRSRLTRYLSPPLFPVRIRDLESRVELHDVPGAPWRVGEFELMGMGVIHPGPTVGYRIETNGRAIGYVPDHEPAIGGLRGAAEWTSGYAIARDVDLLLHDAQYTADEYQERVGWGHSSVEHAVAIADLTRVRTLGLFHHEPDHPDSAIDEMVELARGLRRDGDVVAASEGSTLQV